MLFLFLWGRAWGVPGCLGTPEEGQGVSAMGTSLPDEPLWTQGSGSPGFRQGLGDMCLGYLDAGGGLRMHLGHLDSHLHVAPGTCLPLGVFLHSFAR